MRAFAMRALELLAEEIGAKYWRKRTNSKTGNAMPSDIDPRSGFRLPLPNREDLDEAGKAAYDRATKPGATIAGLQGPAGIQLYSPKTAAHPHRDEPLPALRGGLHAACARGRDPDHRARDGQPVRMGGARAGGAQGRRAAATIDVIKHRRSTAGLDDDRRHRHRAWPPDLARPQGQPETFAKAKAIFGPNKLIELVMLMGNYAGTAALLATVDMQLHAGKKPLLPIP